MGSRPRWHRKSFGNRISWEIYSWKSWFITISPGSLEIQINKWPVNVEFERTP